MYVIRRGSAKQGRAFIDLIERVGADDVSVGARVENGLGAGEQGLARTQRGQYPRFGVGTGDSVSPSNPVGDGSAQTGVALVRRVFRQTARRVPTGADKNFVRIVRGVALRQIGRA